MSQFAAFEESEADEELAIPFVARWTRILRDFPASTARLVQLYFSQGRLIFLGSVTQGHSHAHVVPHPGVDLLQLDTTCGQRIAAIFGTALMPDGRPCEDAANRPTLLFFYGNNQHLAQLHQNRLFDRLRRLGVNVMIPEYVGYGLSSGDANEAGCYATADAAYQHLCCRDDIDSRKVVVAGASLGGAVAIDLASRAPAICGLITLITFTSMPDMARVLQPNVPIWRFIRHKFDSESKMPRVKCPTLIIHSTGDELVPHSMADRLSRACGGAVTRLKIEGAGHSSVEMLEGGGGVIHAAMSEFLARRT
jgi:pimeloyl-ACP methyl ester carboxylesterase